MRVYKDCRTIPAYFGVFIRELLSVKWKLPGKEAPEDFGNC